MSKELSVHVDNIPKMLQEIFINRKDVRRIEVTELITKYSTQGENK